MGTIWKQSGSQQQVGISRPPLGRVRPIPTTCLPGLGLGPLHDDRSGLNALPVQPGPSPRRAMMRQAARRDMQPAVSVSCLNAAACIGMDDERVTARVRVRVIAQAVAARVLSPLLQIRSRGEYLRGPTDEEVEEDQAGRDKHHSPVIRIIYSIVVIADGAIWRPSLGRLGQAVDEREAPKVTSSRVRVYKPKVSHLFAFAPNRVRHSGCCMAPAFPSLPWDDDAPTHSDVHTQPSKPPRFCCSALVRAQRFVPVRRCVRVCARLFVTKRIANQTRNSGRRLPRIVGNSRAFSWGILRNGRLSWRRMFHKPRTGE